MFCDPADIVRKSRSLVRINTFWHNKKLLKQSTILALVNKVGGIRPSMQIEIFGEPYLSLL